MGSRCRSADKGSESGYSLVLECLEPDEWKESIQLEDDVQVIGVTANTLGDFYVL
jgi:hypothetical protein